MQKGDTLDKVFVYGTLKSGYGNNRLLTGSLSLGAAYTLQTFRLFNAGFPVSFFEPKGHPVLGELFEIPDDLLDVTISRLDSLESEGSMYRRETVRVLPLSSAAPAVDTYMYVGIPQFWRDRLDDRLITPNTAGFLQWDRETRW